MSKKPVLNHKKNFETLQDAFKVGNVCIMQCYDKLLEEEVAVICTYSQQEEEVEVVPFASFHNGNPFERFIPPEL